MVAKTLASWRQVSQHCRVCRDGLANKCHQLAGATRGLIPEACKST